jgi:hypothetical protein
MIVMPLSDNTMLLVYYLNILCVFVDFVYTEFFFWIYKLIIIIRRYYSSKFLYTGWVQHNSDLTTDGLWW